MQRCRHTGVLGRRATHAHVLMCKCANLFLSSDLFLCGIDQGVKFEVREPPPHVFTPSYDGRGVQISTPHRQRWWCSLQCSMGGTVFFSRTDK